MTDAEGNEIGKVFIGGLSQSTNDDSLRNYFSQFGSLEDCVVMMDNKTGRSRGFAYIKFIDERTVLSVLECSPHLLDGKIVDVKQCNVHMKGRNRRSLKIFVGGIGLDDNEESIRTFFSQFGNVTDVNLMLDQAKQRHRGFAFVGFEEENVVKDLILKHFISMNGKHVEIKAMEPPNFARKLVATDSVSNSAPGMILCNSLSPDQLSSEEKLLRLSPQYSLQPIVWSNPANTVVNSNAVWANPYQFEKIPSNFVYQQQPPNCPHFHQYIPNSNQTMWGMMPQQTPGPWGYQVPLNNGNVYQYSSVPANTWQYPYVLQYPQQPVLTPNTTRSTEQSNLVESQKLIENEMNNKNEENLQNISNDTSNIHHTMCNTSKSFATSNECWMYNNNKEIITLRNNEQSVRPNGDDNVKNPFTEFNFFQPNY